MNRGKRASYVCYDCGRVTKAVMAVRRPGTDFAYVCRTGTGCARQR